jgi:hypothetical protein
MSKNQELEELYNTISQIYLKNIDYFSKKHPELYKQIKAFEKLNIENYFLEFENNHFELKDKTGKRFYNCDPFFDAQKRIRNIKNILSFSLIKNNYILNSVHYKDSINAYEFINKYLDLDKENYSHDKFIFLGTLLGAHLNDFDKILNSKAYLIIENDIEIFRLSMFLTDYKELSINSKLFFIINENDLNIKIKDFLDYKYEFNNQISFEIVNEQYIPYIDKLTSLFIDNDPYNYPFSEYLVSLKRANFYQKESNYGILKLDKQVKLLNKPVLFLGAGPSLAQDIEWVYMNQDSFIIVCAAACLKRLELLDIIPDVILTIDGQEKLVLSQFEVQDTYYINSIIISSIKTDISVINKLNSDNCFYIQDNLGLFEKHKVFTGVTVGDIGLELLLSLGVKEIYMLGFDSAIREDGKTHDGIHKNLKVKVEESNIKKNAGFNTRKDLIKVKGNFQKEVYTLMIYKQMIDSINQITHKLTKDIEINNLSNGAYFDNTNALRKEDIKKLSFVDKKSFHKELKKDLIELSVKDNSTKDISNLKQELKIIKKINILKESNYKKEFLKQKSSYKNALSFQIIEKFFKLISPYSSYINSKKAKELEFSQFKELLKELELSFKL